MDREMLDEILSLDRYKIAAIINNLLVNDEERSIRRWRLCTVPVMIAQVFRFLFASSMAFRFAAGVSFSLLWGLDRAIHSRQRKFVTYQWLVAFVCCVLVLSSNYNAINQHGFTWMEAYVSSVAPFVPSICLFYMSGGPPGLLLAFLNFVYLVAVFSVGPKTQMERDKFSACLFGWALQTIIGLIWISFENSTHDMLKGALKTALDSNAAKTKFVAWLSHDLRTPLVGMFGFLEQLIEDTNPTKEQKDLLEKIRVCTDSVNGLITNLLDFSMLESGVFNLKPQVFNIHDSLQFHCSMLQPLAAKKDISLIYRFTKDDWYERLSEGQAKPVFVIGDWLRLQQLLTNLVTNSIKYSQPGTQIMVTCHFGMEDNSFGENAIEHNHSKNDSNSNSQKIGGIVFSQSQLSSQRPVQIKLTIEDQGVGIPAADIPLIFDAFFQVIRNSQKGSGLGLFIVREIIKAMGGTITCTSQVGKGTKFNVLGLKFPIASEKDVRDYIRRTTDRLSAEEAKKVRILVAEDNATNQQVLKRMLTKSMFQFKIVNDGQEAVDEWQKNPRAYDLILMDLQMPVKNGIEATKEIRKIEKTQLARIPIPIVALTATTYPEELDNAIQSGMAGFLIKPLTALSLDESILRLVRAPSQSVEEKETSVKEALRQYK